MSLRGRYTWGMLPASSPVVVWLETPAQLIDCLQAALAREAVALPLRRVPGTTTVFALCADGVAESVDVIGEPLGSAGDAGWLVLLSPTDDEGEGALLATLAAAESVQLRWSAMLPVATVWEPLAEAPQPPEQPQLAVVSELPASPEVAVLPEPPEPSLFDLLFAEGALEAPSRPASLPPVALLEPLSLLTTQSNDNWTPIALPEAPVVRAELRELDRARDAEPPPDPVLLGTLADLFEDTSVEGAERALDCLRSLPLEANRAVGRAVARFTSHADAGVCEAAFAALHRLGGVDRAVVARAGAVLLDGDPARIELQTAAARALSTAGADAKASAVRVLRQVLEPKRLSLLLVMRGPTVEKRHAPPVLEEVFRALFALAGEAARPLGRSAVLAASGERRAELQAAFERADSALAQN